MAKNVLIGLKKWTKKGVNGAPDTAYEVMFLASDFKEAEVQNGSVGKSCEQIFVPINMVGFLKPEHIGKELALDYEVSNGRAYLIGFDVKK